MWDCERVMEQYQEMCATYYDSCGW